jgi:Arc/MetJ family transcription regulator
MAKQKTTMNLDKELLAEARAASGAGSDVDTVHLGLRELVRREAQKRMATFIGSEKGKAIHDAPRRREAPVKRRVRKSA